MPVSSTVVPGTLLVYVLDYTNSILVVPSVGIEPTTLGLLDPRSNQLSYEGFHDTFLSQEIRKPPNCKTHALFPTNNNNRENCSYSSINNLYGGNWLLIIIHNLILNIALILLIKGLDNGLIPRQMVCLYHHHNHCT